MKHDKYKKRSKAQHVRIVGSMTTIPQRIAMIEKPLQHILNLSPPLDAFYLNIPKGEVKGQEYEIPEFISKAQKNGHKTKLIVNRCEDCGPLTKLAPTLSVEKDPNTYIVTFDDDIIPHPHILRNYHKKIQKYPEAVLTYGGMSFSNTILTSYQMVVDNKEDQEVDLIMGVFTVCYKRKFFSTEKELINFEADSPIAKPLFFNDDHRVSAYLQSRNVPLISIGCDYRDYFRKYESGNIEALSSRYISLCMEHLKITDYFQKKGYYHRNYNSNHSLVFSGFLAAVLVVLIIVFAALVSWYLLLLLLLVPLVIYLLCYIFSLNDYQEGLWVPEIRELEEEILDV
jgi:hypothetical protein